MERGGNLPPLSEPSSAKSVNLFERLWAALDERARAEGISRSELLRRIVEDYDAAAKMRADADAT